MKPYIITCPDCDADLAVEFDEGVVCAVKGDCEHSNWLVADDVWCRMVEDDHAREEETARRAAYDREVDSRIDRMRDGERVGRMPPYR